MYLTNAGTTVELLVKNKGGPNWSENTFSTDSLDGVSFDSSGSRWSSVAFLLADGTATVMADDGQTTSVSRVCCCCEATCDLI